MSSNFGNKVQIQIFGQSHSEMLGVVIDGLPSGIKIDMQKINDFLLTRQGGNNSYSTQRKEKDMPNIVSGIVNGKTCGAPLCALFENSNTISKDYDKIAEVPRPSHADLAAYFKHNGYNDVRGGGHFSGRMTLPLCFAGAVCMQILEEKDICITAHIKSICDICDDSFHPLSPQSVCDDFPVINMDAGKKMISFMESCAKDGDSVGGIIECSVTGLPIGVGEPMFEGLENVISAAVFSVPAVKGIEFGLGFESASKRGSEINDGYSYENGCINLLSNNSGGITGGLSTGAPLIFRTVIKPTPSIFKEQESINIKDNTNVPLKIQGRHDPCIVPRAVPCIKSAAAIAIINLL